MAVTAEWWLAYDCPSRWGECSCVEWLRDLTRAAGGEPDLTDEAWAAHPSEARALVALRTAGGYEAVLSSALAPYGWHVAPLDTPWTPGHLVLVDDVRYGVLPAAVTPGPTLMIRHAHGLAAAIGRVVQVLEYREPAEGE